MITIVMPVHNTGEVLSDSIRSLLKQSYKEFEVICVDDNSTDKITMEILNKYEKLDDRINVIHMSENIGAAEARNLGIKKAKGEYILFLDADDVFVEDMLRCAYLAIKDKDADICVWGYRAFSCLNGKDVINYEVKMEGTDLGKERCFSVADLPEEGLVFLGNVPWNKLCRLSFIKKHHIEFQTLQCANDVYYSVMCSIHAKKIVCINEMLLNYRCGLKQQISSNRDPRCACKAIEKVIKEIDLELFEEMKNKLAYLFVETIMYEMRNSCDLNWQEECYYLFIKMWKQYFSGVILCNEKLNWLVEHTQKLAFGEGIGFFKGDFYHQLSYYKDSIYKELAFCGKIVVWGFGKRGRSCIDFLKDNKIDLLGVVDLSAVIEVEMGKNKIQQLSSEEAFEKADLIIATNNNIYQYLKKKTKIKLINLERYCEIG